MVQPIKHDTWDIVYLNGDLFLPKKEVKKEVLQNIEQASENFEKELEKIESKRGKADTIRTRIIRTISQKSKSDPAYYKKFSQRIEETIEAYRERRISDSEYLEKMQNALKGEGNWAARDAMIFGRKTNSPVKKDTYTKFLKRTPQKKRDELIVDFNTVFFCFKTCGH